VHHFKTWRLRPTKYETTLNLKTEGTGFRRATDAARPRRRGDRMMRWREFITLLGGGMA
jgi:hypothetical protein